MAEQKKDTKQTILDLADTLSDVDYETTILIEEMSELMKVLCKHKRKLKFPQYNKYDKAKLYEELAHVEISLVICKHMLGVDEGILEESILKRIATMTGYRGEIAPPGDKK